MSHKSHSVICLVKGSGFVYGRFRLLNVGLVNALEARGQIALQIDQIKPNVNFQTLKKWLV